MADEDLSLGDDEELAVGNPSSGATSGTAAPGITRTSRGDFKLRLPLESAEKALLFGRSPDEEIGKFLLRNLEVYRPFGLEKFEAPTPEVLSRMDGWADDWVREANSKWGMSNPGRLDDFQKALGLARAIFGKTDKYLSHSRVLRSVALGQVEALVRGKLDDGKVDPHELVHLLSHATAMGLRRDEGARKEVLATIEATVRDESGRIVPYQDFFCERVAVLPSLERLDSSRCRAVLLSDYTELLQAHNEIYGLPPDLRSSDELAREMEGLLASKGLALLSRIQLFEREVLVGKSIDTKQPLPDDLYFELKNLAVHSYGFTPDDWDRCCSAQKIRRKQAGESFVVDLGRDDAGLPLAAHSLEELIDLFERFPEKGTTCLYGGNLENALHASGNRDLEVRVGQVVRSEYPNDRRAGLTKVVFILQPQRPLFLLGGKVCYSLADIAEGLEGNASESISSQVGIPNSTVQLWLESRGMEVLAREYRDLNATADLSREKKLAALVWLLDGKNFRRSSRTFLTPAEVVALPVDSFKEELARELFDNDSKMSFWIENMYPNYLPAVLRWRTLNRINAVTLTYALEPEAPFHLGASLMKAPGDWVAAASTDTRIADELGFWLANYQQTTTDAALLNYLTSNMIQPEQRAIFSSVFDGLSQRRLGNVPFDQFWSEFVALAHSAHDAEVLDDQVYQGLLQRIVGYLLQNQTPMIDGLVQTYLEGAIGDSKPQGEFLQALFRYYMRPTVDRDFYVRNIQRLLVSAVQKGLVPSQVMDDQRKYFVAKYEQELPHLPLSEQTQALETIRKIDAGNDLVGLYDRTKLQVQKAIDDKNRVTRLSNALKMDVMIFCGSLVFTTVLVATSLHQWVGWAPWSPPLSLLGIGVLVVALISTLSVIALRKRKGR